MQAAEAEPKYFSGHTGSEQYLFFNTCLYFLHGTLLLVFPEELRWRQRRIRPRSPQQLVDVFAAFCVCALLVFETCAAMGVVGGGARLED